MRVETCLFISTNPDSDITLDPNFEAALREAGGDVHVLGHERLIIRATPEHRDAVAEFLGNTQSPKITDLRIYDLPKPSGTALTINFRYFANDQIASASVDERLWAVMTSAPHKSAESDAFVALFEDVEIDPTDAPEATFTVDDVMIEVRFWPGPDALKWDPEMWDEDEPMVEILFTALANLPNQRGVVEVAIAGTQSATHAFKVPARLLPVGEPFPEEEILNSAAVPAGVRAWVQVAPYSLDVEGHDPSPLSL